jgi:GntR family transcriptional regulator
MGQFGIMVKLDPSAGQALYLQLVEQIQHAIETGMLRDGDLMPGIRTLAEELVLSHNTVAKAYTHLEQEGWVELRHGSGAYVSAKGLVTSRAGRVRMAQERVGELIGKLRQQGLSTGEIRRAFEAELLSETPAARKR